MADAVSRLYDIPADDPVLAAIPVEAAPRRALGDLAVPLAFELARRLRKAPRVIAQEIAEALGTIDGFSRIEAAPNGYVNFFLDRPAFARAWLDGRAAAAPPGGGKAIVEHTAINPNKAAHIGHLRNGVLGDTFVRVLRAAGEQVEVQSYIDNTGVQVADVVVGFEHVERMTLADVQALDQSLPPAQPFDYYCWDLYARVGLFYRNGDADAKEDPARLQLRAQTLHALEAGDNATSALADYVATRIVQCHLSTMERLGVHYDLLPRESDILHMGFWQQAFERLKETGTIRFETEGRNAGCWIMPTDLHAGTDEHEADKIIVRSNGTVTYAGKDIAYQLWKLGQLKRDFYYKPFRQYPNQHVVWVSTSIATEETPGHPAFGGGRAVYNVIDSRQSYTQDVVRRGAAAVAPEVGEAASVHLAYEMVALSPAACVELGLELSAEDRARPFIEMSGRKGLGVKVDDLINRLEAGALAEVEKRHPDLPRAEQLTTAHVIAISALRYFLLKWTRNSLIAFDFAEALAFEGETGPYCLNAVVRANSIFRKLAAPVYTAAQEFIQQLAPEGLAAEQVREILHGAEGDDMWALVTLAARLDEVIAHAAAQAEPAHLAKYAFQLAKAFHSFYHHHPIITEESAARRAVLVAIADLVRRQLTAALATLGIEVPERM